MLAPIGSDLRLSLKRTVNSLDDSFLEHMNNFNEQFQQSCYVPSLLVIAYILLEKFNIDTN